MSSLGFLIENDNLGKTKPFILPEIAGMATRHMKSFQEEAFLMTFDASFSAIKMPTGSGKTSVANFIAAKNIQDNPNQKIIIAAPQLIIGQNFRQGQRDPETGEYLHTRLVFKNLPRKKMSKKAYRLFMDTLKAEEYFDWSIGTDLTSTEEMQSTSTIKALEEFLENDGITPSSRIALCTHQTLVALYKKLRRENKLDKFDNIKFIIDEAHHILALFENESHGLGEFVVWILRNHKDRKLSLLLLTATPFRGDMRRIIPEEYMPLFERSTYVLPFDKYMKSMEFLRHFDYGFACYEETLGTAQVLKTALTREYKKTLIFLPRRTPGQLSRYPSSKKQEEVETILKGIALSYGWEGETEIRPRIVDNKTIDGIFQLRVGKDTWVNIVDLVDDQEHIRKSVKAYLTEINDNKDFADYILALEIGKEGFDWQWCDQVIIFGKIGSLTQLVQMIGRALRDVKGKPNAKIQHFLPVETRNLDEREEITENLNDVVNAVSLSMLMYEVLNPIIINLPNGDNEDGEVSITGSDLMDMVFGEETRRNLFISQAQDRISTIQIDEGRDVPFEERLEIIRDIMEEMDVDEEMIENYAEELTKYLRTRNRRILRRIIDGLEGSRIIEELRGLFSHVQEIPTEAYIAAWTANQFRSKTLSKYHDAIKLINGVLDDEQSLQKKDEFKSFVIANGKWPSRKSQDPVEASLGRWFESIKRKEAERRRASKKEVQHA